MDVCLHDLAEAAVAVRVALMKEKYDLATIDARVLQATLEDLDDKGFLIIQKDELLALAKSDWGDWEDSLYPILEKIDVDTSEGL